MEVTDGLFSRCEKKNDKREEVKKELTKKSSRMSSARACEIKKKRAINGFILFYMEMYAKNSGKHVTCVAKEAGKRWRCLSLKEKEKYKQMAKEKAESGANNAENAAAMKYPKLKIERK